MDLLFENNFVSQICSLDSFYESKILIYIANNKLQQKIKSCFNESGFTVNVYAADNYQKFIKFFDNDKFDLIIFDLRNKHNEFDSKDLLKIIRKSDADVSIISMGPSSIDVKMLLEFSISASFEKNFTKSNLIRASKKALGEKISRQIGMQFFDALFGIQMCTHRELHARTFEHVIRTTKIYGKFLLNLNSKKYLELNSWSLKNCLMASLVHDLGKLLVMPNVLYKDGGLSGYEFQQVRRHSWNSITALLGGQDIRFFAEQEYPIRTVTGYNDKNLSEQVKIWINKINNKDLSAMQDMDVFFDLMGEKPFIHSLNKDLLYIVFRHHDGIVNSYHTRDELDLFGKVLNTKINEELSEDSVLDLVTNALSICDMYDALMDSKRDYRKGQYSKFFALFLLYAEMKKKKFFPILFKEFLEFISKENDYYDTCSLFFDHDAESVYKAIKEVYNNFRITKEQESEFNDFISNYYKDIKAYIKGFDKNILKGLNAEWIDFYEKQRKKLLNDFLLELNNYNLIEKKIEDFSLDDAKTFDMLYNFYYSYNSDHMRKKVIRYIVKSVVKPILSKDVKKRLIKILKTKDITEWNEMNKSFIESGYEKRNMLKYFYNLDEEALLYDFNEFLNKY